MDIDAIIVAHLALVRAVALRRVRTCPCWVDVEDLISVGTIGLVEAARRFDPRRGASFATFVLRRVDGAMRDYIRANLPMSRRDYAGVVDGDLARYRAIDQLDTRHELVRDQRPTPEALAIARECSANLRDRVRRLPLRERAIIIGRYFHGRMVYDIARDHHVVACRISQLHARACRRLRASFGAGCG